MTERNVVSLPTHELRIATAGSNVVGALGLAQLFRENPEAALSLAAANRNDHWSHIERRKAVLRQELLESLEGRDEPSSALRGLRGPVSP